MRPASAARVAVAGRLARAAAAALGILVLWVLPAAAVGVDGVDLRVDLPTTDEGRPLLDLQELQASDTELAVQVRNTTPEPRAVRVYAVAARPSDDGESFSLAGPGSASWLRLGDERIDLAGGEEATRLASVAPGGVPDDATHVAVVLETGTDGTLITRAARVIELGEHAPAALAGWPILLATVLLLVAVAAHVVRAVRARVTAGKPPGVTPLPGTGPPGRCTCPEPR